jgi:DnaJ like chaperone protein
MGYGKWIAGGLGWTFGGPIGGLIGFALGSLFEKTKHTSSTGTREETMRGDFAITFIVLVAAVMKADGKILKSELNYVKTYMLKFFGEEKTKDMLHILKELLQKEINIYEVTSQVKANMNYSSRLQLLHFLFGIAQADGHIDISEINIINEIANGIGITNADKKSESNLN